jgi:Mg-chelatase subunit ChlI
VSEQTRELRARNQELNVLLQELTQRLAASEEQHREQCAHNQELMQRLAASEQQYRELLTRTHALELAEAREQGRREFVVPALAELETKRQREDAELEEKHEGDGTLRAAATKAFIGAPAAPVEEPAETEQAKAARKPEGRGESGAQGGSQGGSQGSQAARRGGGARGSGAWSG